MPCSTPSFGKNGPRAPRSLVVTDRVIGVAGDTGSCVRASDWTLLPCEADTALLLLQVSKPRLTGAEQPDQGHQGLGHSWEAPLTTSQQGCSGWLHANPAEGPGWLWHPPGSHSASALPVPRGRTDPEPHPVGLTLKEGLNKGLSKACCSGAGTPSLGTAPGVRSRLTAGLRAQLLPECMHPG